MTPTVSVPPMSAEEKGLLAQQTATLKQQSDLVNSQISQQKALLPFMAEQAGVKLKFDDKGNVVGAEKIVDPMQAQRDDIQKSLLDREQAALSGNLPVDPALERDLKNQEQTLRDKLQSQLGTGYETSTPGIQALDQFNQTAEGLRYGARTGQLTLADQLGLAHQEMGLNQSSQSFGQFRTSTFADPLALGGAVGQNAAGYSNPLSVYAQDRNMQFQANGANAAAQGSMLSGFGNLAGMALGSVFGPVGTAAGGALAKSIFG